MTRETAKVLDQAIKLAPKQRRELAQFLLDTLEPAQDRFYANRAIEKEWDKEIRRRVRELKSGRVKAIPWEVVRRELWRRIDESGKNRTRPSGASRHRRSG